jgi:hypothetical protein
MMRRSIVRTPALRKALCAPLAAILILLGSRSTVECISTLALPQGSVPAASEAAAIDRKPKPTRQQNRTTIAALVRLQWLSLAKPELPAALLLDEVLPPTAPRRASSSSGADSVQATRPAYLDPHDTAPRRQLPPPTFAALIA